jgi:3'-5' exonuclease
MSSHVIVWDLETVPDLRGFAAANDLVGKNDDKISEAMGDRFPKHIYHSIVCIGALIAHRNGNDHWEVSALGAPHVGERSEKELIASFVDKIAELTPQLVTFNGNSFDLPVLRYRAMIHAIAAPGLSARPYFNRYTDDAVDLCDVLSSFNSQAKATLHEICRVMGSLRRQRDLVCSSFGEVVSKERSNERSLAIATVADEMSAAMVEDLFMGSDRMSFLKLAASSLGVPRSSPTPLYLLTLWQLDANFGYRC